MPIPLPEPGLDIRFRQRDAGSAFDAKVTAVDALRANADDYLDTGDPRLALERAFRWGYRTERGETIAGLQQHLQDLRSHRDRLLRHIAHDAFLASLDPELDRIDALDPSLTEHVAAGDARDGSAIDRLIGRLGRGYRTAEAQAELDALVQRLRQGAREEGQRSRTASANPRGAGHSSGSFGAARSAGVARAGSLRRMLFQDGMEAGPASMPSSWRRDADPIVSLADPDLRVLGELDGVEATLDRLERLGSVVELQAIDDAELESMANGELRDWIAGWRQAIDSVLGSGSRSRASQSVAVPAAVIAAIGRDLLKTLFRAASSPIAGEHESFQAGSAGDTAEATVAWDPGMAFDLNLVSTLTNAVRREARTTSRSVSISADDFMVNERHSRTSMAMILAIDRSRSMGQSGAWTAAKKVALAMHELILQSYPRDALGLLAFSSTASPVAVGDLPEMQWDRYEHGTHLQAALALGRALLRRSRGGAKQIVVITDGEPTLATIGDQDVFSSPPSGEVLDATMSEVILCTREGITINVVMLGASGRDAFAEQVTRINRGRMFEATNDTLGTYILRDYTSR